MKKKILTLFMLVCTIVLATSSVFASDGLFQLGVFEDVYKLSENKEIVLPFLNMFSAAATYDSDVNHSGITFATSTMDINKKLNGVHLIFSSDMLNVTGEVEHGIIYANNVVIHGKVSKDSLIMGASVKILDTAEISEDVIIIADNLEIEGNVKGNVIATVSNNTKVTGKIDKDLRIITNSLELGNELVKGNLYVETDMDITTLKEAYPNGTFEVLTKETKSTSEKVIGIVTKGVVTVVIYTVVAYLIVRKENNIIKKATDKFKDNTVYGVIMGMIAFMMILILPLILILLAVYGLGIIAWPVLIAYVALILFSISTATFTVGTAIYTAIQDKVKGHKVLVLAAIFIVLYAICNIPYIAYYALVAINLIALAIIITGLTKKKKDSIEVKIEDKK